MISIQQAKKLIAENRLARVKEQVPILKVNGKVLAEPVIAPFDSPQFDNSAMDGVAVQWEDVKEVKSEKSVILELVGESSAGKPWAGILKPGQAVCINTGAVVPDGADTVIPQEQCNFEDTNVRIEQVKELGAHIRRQGEEYRKGDQLLAENTPLNPAITGVLGSIGMDSVPVFRMPEVTLMVTGTELVAARSGTKLEAGQIYDSNYPMLYHYLKMAGIDEIKTTHVKDKRMDVLQAIQQAQKTSDIIISTGGVSVGPHDHIPDAAQEAGFSPLFHHVAQKPGKPFYFAMSKESNTLYFGLPGNPVSAFMTFTWYVYPELCYYLGKDFTFRKQKSALTQAINNPQSRTIFLRMKGVKNENTILVEPVKQQGSHLIHALSVANGFIIIPPSTKWDVGQEVLFYYFP